MFKNSKLTEQLQDMRISPQRLCNHTLNTDTCIPSGQRNTLTWPTKKADAVFLAASGRNQKLSRSSSCLSERKQNTSKKNTIVISLCFPWSCFFHLTSLLSDSCGDVSEVTPGCEHRTGFLSSHSRSTFSSRKSENQTERYTGAI